MVVSQSEIPFGFCIINENCLGGVVLVFHLNGFLDCAAILVKAIEYVKPLVSRMPVDASYFLYLHCDGIQGF